MSADNTILVLRKDGKIYVNHVGAVENITHFRCTESLAYYLERAKTFETLEEAMSVAHKMDRDIQTEYGVHVFVW